MEQPEIYDPQFLRLMTNWSNTSRSRTFRIGFERCKSHPASKVRCVSSLMALAVNAIIGVLSEQ
jgi:hypothetical protein